MKAIFVTGTDTAVGKTLVCGMLARYLSKRGFSVITQKWVQTGCRGTASDINMHLKLMARPMADIKEYLKDMSPYVFHHACSPHLAAQLEGRKIDMRKIRRSFNHLSLKFDFVIVEGSGGVMVPLNGRDLLIDAACSLDISFLIVAENRLGAVNHTLLTIEALKNRKASIIGVVFNSLQDSAGYILKDNPRIIRKLSKQDVLGSIKKESSSEKLYAGFVPIAAKILRKLNYE